MIARGHSPVTLDAIRGEHNTGDTETTMPGYKITYQQVDWLVDRNQLDERFPNYVPQRGDVITDSDNARYIVSPDQGSDRVWRWSGPQRQVMRIHTKPEEVT